MSANESELESENIEIDKNMFNLEDNQPITKAVVAF